MKLLIMQSHSFPCYLLPLDPNTFLITIFTDTFSVFSSLSVEDQIRNGQTCSSVMSISLVSKPENKGVCTERY